MNLSKGLLTYFTTESESVSYRDSVIGIPRFSQTGNETTTIPIKKTSMTLNCKRKVKRSEMHCHVCGDVAPDHIHYGGIACFSCRAFFRRSVPKQSSYFCSSDKACEISTSTRKNCQYCRFHKCLLAGMKPSWVLSDEEKLSRNVYKGSCKVLTVYSSGSESESKCSSPLSQSLSIPFTMEEERKICQLLESQNRTRENIPLPASLFDELVELTYDSKKTLRPSSMIELYRVLYSRVASFAMTVSEFETLYSEDKKQLLSQNMDSMATVRIAPYFNSDGSGNPQSQIQIFKKSIGGSNAITMSQVFQNPWVSSEEHKSTFFSTFTKLTSLVTNEASSLLFQLVTLFSVLELNVVNRYQIERSQEYMALLFHRYLKSQNDTDLPKYIMMLNELRILSNMLTDTTLSYSPSV